MDVLDLLNRSLDAIEELMSRDPEFGARNADDAIQQVLDDLRDVRSGRRPIRVTAT